MSNKLYFGDCLEVMRKDVPEESVGLIYLDPPFNSKRLYNAFIEGAQWMAFKDTWRWHEAVEDFHQLVGIPSMAGTMEGLRSILGEGPNLAYLSYMGNRLWECRKVLKPTGSIYLHCDPTMSHYLKVVMDAIFGRQNFRNEIVWCYRGGGVPRMDFARKHDVLLRYSKTSEWVFHKQYVPYSQASKDLVKRRGGVSIDNKPRDLGRGASMPDWWADINSLQTWSPERLGYPTQKPVTFLNRIIQASSNKGDIVLDPFCGCGTTVHSAQGLNRNWIGIDICVNACKIIEDRLRYHFDSVWSEVEFIGMPRTLDHAITLADLDKFRFERWAAALVDGMEPNQKQRGDQGIDGRGRFPIRKGTFIDLVSQVKGGGTGPGDVQAFNGARQQVQADLGIFICFKDRVTHAMRNAAASTGLFMEVPRVQIYTVDDYFEGRRPKLPMTQAVA